MSLQDRAVARPAGAREPAADDEARERTPDRRVSEIQRARLAFAMTELVCERGAGAVVVSQVVARASVSRRTFYELFEDREDCFLAAFDRAVFQAAANVVPAFQSEGPWSERIRLALERLLVFFDDRPEMGYLCGVGALGAGPRVLERRAEVLGALIDAVHEGRAEAAEGRQVSRLVAEGVVGAVLGVVHARLLECDRKPLLRLLNQLMGMIVLPYAGPTAAECELARRAPRPARRGQAPGDPLKDLDMRLTYRTVRVLHAIATVPAGSNRRVGEVAGISDQGQISKLLARLRTLGLIENNGGDHSRGEPNAWSLTVMGRQAVQAIHT